MSAADYTTVPEGRYAVTVRDVRESLNRAGAARWALALEVAEGEHKGRLAAWDAVVWSERGRPRARRILRALGIDATDATDLKPMDLVGRTALVEVRRVEFTPGDDETATIIRNEVPYDGWAPIEAAAAATAFRPTLLSDALRAAADLQEGEGRATAQELRELGDSARRLEAALEDHARPGGMLRVLEALRAFARARAKPASDAWQDRGLARSWARVAGHLDRARDAAEGLP